MNRIANYLSCLVHSDTLNQKFASFCYHVPCTLTSHSTSLLLKYTCGVRPRSKQSPQQFPRHYEELTYCSYCELTLCQPEAKYSHFPPTSHLVTMVVRGVRSKQTASNNSTPVKQGLGERKRKDSENNEAHTKQAQYCGKGLQPDLTRKTLLSECNAKTHIYLYLKYRSVM